MALYRWIKTESRWNIIIIMIVAAVVRSVCWRDSERTEQKQFCVQLPTSADNVALPASDRRSPLLQRRCSWAPAVLHSLDISCSPGPQQQTRSSGVRRPYETDRRTDARQLHRPCSAYYTGSANNKEKTAETEIALQKQRNNGLHE